MSKSILLLTDDPSRSAFLADAFGKWFEVKIADLSAAPSSGDTQAVFLIADADLSKPETANDLQTAIEARKSINDRVFTVRQNNHRDAALARKLGANKQLTRPVDPKEIKRYASRFVSTNEPSSKATAGASPEETADGLASIQNAFYETVSSGRPLPKQDIAECSGQLITSLTDSSLTEWLEAVRKHHSYTYRHCMLVSGLASSFALHLGMRREDVERLTTAAMLHDIGKVKIPLAILDKPSELTVEERELIKMHPVFSWEILSADNQFSDEIIDIAHHHHEYLDGSGYPDGLKGDEIKDTVRIMTIVDIFAALVEQRSYKEPMPPEKAYEIMLGMDGKLEKCILQAFEPVAMAARYRENEMPAQKLAV